MDVWPATREQLATERKKLPSATVSQMLMRWHRSVNQMSGTFVLLFRKPEQITLDHVDEWLQRLADLEKDITALRKKLQPKKKKRSSQRR